MRSASRIAPFGPSSAGERTIRAPYSSSSRSRSGVAFAGTTQVSAVALELRDERERDSRVAARRLEQLAARLELAPRLRRLDHRLRDAVLDRAGRVRALELRVEPHAVGGASRGSSTSGVSPTVSSSDGASACSPPAIAGRRMTRRALRDRRVEALQRAHVLAVHVDVHEGRDLAVLEHLRAQAGEPRGEVVEQLAERRAGSLDLTLAAHLGAKRRRNPDAAHRAAQNST